MDKLLSSKRFWLAVAGVATVLLRDQFELPVTEEQVQDVVLLVAAWIVGDSLRATDPAKQPPTIQVVSETSTVES